ncbi:unnamed protein product [Chironomus riparius]|uniref:Uncharacterized protein n=1 Tax=Chironomus riparius TaxID=315576 RepID=A0A9N9S0V0_9DIPT|nr:unnamed protein product [Chironomus riparius]
MMNGETIESKILEILDNNLINDEAKLTKIHSLISQKNQNNEKEKNEEEGEEETKNESSSINNSIVENEKSEFIPIITSSPSKKKKQIDENIISISSDSSNLKSIDKSINSDKESDLDLSAGMKSFLNNLQTEAQNDKLDLRDLSFSSLNDDKHWTKVRDKKNNFYYYPEKPKTFVKYPKTLEELQSKKKTRKQELEAQANKYNSSNFLSRWSEYENIVLKRKHQHDLEKKTKSRRPL